MVIGQNDLLKLILQYLIPLVSVVVLITDLAAGRIYNWLTLPVFLIGLALGFAFGSLDGLLMAFLGGLAGLGLFGILFFFRVMGGGDVKLLIALGSLGGPKYALEVAILSVLLGGLLAAVLLLLKGRLPDFLKRMYWFLVTLFVKELEVEVPKINRQYTMPFGVPIAIAAVWVFFFHPLQSWGVFPWL